MIGGKGGSAGSDKSSHPTQPQRKVGDECFSKEAEKRLKIAQLCLALIVQDETDAPPIVLARQHILLFRHAYLFVQIPPVWKVREMKPWDLLHISFFSSLLLSSRCILHFVQMTQRRR